MNRIHVSFDGATLAALHRGARGEHRSISNYLAALVLRAEGERKEGVTHADFEAALNAPPTEPRKGRVLHPRHIREGIAQGHLRPCSPAEAEAYPEAGAMYHDWPVYPSKLIEVPHAR